MLGTLSWQTELVHRWRVGGGIIEGADLGDPGAQTLLLVQNSRRGGIVDWTPPGGVIDEGEEVLEGLTREVHEETGLAVSSWSGPIYVINAVAPGLGWQLTVEVHRAIGVAGDLLVGSDPDGIVTNADFVPVSDCPERLGGSHRWVSEPLLDWVSQRWDHTRRYNYQIEGTNLSNIRVVGDYEDPR